MTSTIELNNNNLNKAYNKLALDIYFEHGIKKERLAFVGLQGDKISLANKVRGEYCPSNEHVARVFFVNPKLYEEKPDFGTVHSKTMTPDGFNSLDYDVVILFQSIIKTGMKIKDATNAIFDYNRPNKIEVAALIDIFDERTRPTSKADYVIFEVTKDQIADHKYDFDPAKGLYLAPN